MAEAYDLLTEEDGKPVVAVVFAFVTIDGGVRTGYHTLSEVQSRNKLYVARGVSALNADLIEWDKPQ